MRIAQVVINTADAFDEVFAASAAMVGEGHSVELLLLDHVAPGAPRLETRDGVVLRRFAAFPGRRSIAIRSARQYLRASAGGFDIVHAHGLHALPAVEDVPPRSLILSPRLTGVAASRLAVVLRLLQPHRPFDALARSAPIVCTCRGEAELVERALSLGGARITIVPPVVDTTAIHASVPYDVPSDVVLVVDRLERRAHVDRVIAAIAGLSSRFELVITSTGPSRRSLQMFADDLGVADRVRFAPSEDRRRLRRWLRTASVVATLAESETDIALLLEAVAAGAPVVAAATTAHTELVRYVPHGAVRMVSPRSSPLAVADTLEEMADRAPVVTHPALLPSARDVADQLLALYEGSASELAPAGRRRNGRAYGVGRV